MAFMIMTPKNPVDIRRTTAPYTDDRFHTHAACEIYYFHGGRCTYLIGDRIYQLAPGDLIIMHGLTLHRPKVDPRLTYDRTTIHFDPNYARELVKPFGGVDVLKPFRELHNHRIRLEGAAREEFEALLERLCALSERTGPVSRSRFLLAFADLLYIVYELHQKPLAELSALPSAKERNVQEIISYIENHFHEDLHLGDLEKHLHISKNYLANIFREVTGATIFQYLNQRRVNQAKLLFLTERDASVTDVGYRVGFKHPAHFSRVFKQIAGLSPNRYLQAVKKGGVPFV